jgi:hypothetical protein
MNTNQLGVLVDRSLLAGESTGVCLRLVRQFIMDTERLDPHGVTESVREPSRPPAIGPGKRLLQVLSRTWLTGTV